MQLQPVSPSHACVVSVNSIVYSFAMQLTLLLALLALLQQIMLLLLLLLLLLSLSLLLLPIVSDDGDIVVMALLRVGRQ